MWESAVTAGLTFCSPTSPLPISEAEHLLLFWVYQCHVIQHHILQHAKYFPWLGKTSIFPRLLSGELSCSVLSCNCDEGLLSFAINTIMSLITLNIEKTPKNSPEVLHAVRSDQKIFSFRFAFALRQDVQSLCATSSPISDTTIPSVSWKQHAEQLLICFHLRNYSLLLPFLLVIFFLSFFIFVLLTCSAGKKRKILISFWWQTGGVYFHPALTKWQPHCFNSLMSGVFCVVFAGFFLFGFFTIFINILCNIHLSLTLGSFTFFPHFVNLKLSVLPEAVCLLLMSILWLLFSSSDLSLFLNFFLYLLRSKLLIAIKSKM